MKKYIFKFKLLFTITIVLQLICSLISVSMAFLLKYIIEIVNQNNLAKLLQSCFVFIIFILISFLFYVLFGVFKAKYVKHTLIYFKSDIFKNILKKDINTFLNDNSAKYISLLINDVSMIENDYINNVFSLINLGVSFIVSFIAFCFIDLNLTIIVIILSFIVFLIPQFFSKKLVYRRNEYSSSLEKLTILTKDLLTGFEVIKNFNITSKITNLYDSKNEFSEQNKQNFLILQTIIDGISRFFGDIMFLIPMIYGGYLVINNKITIGTLLASIQLMNYVSYPITEAIPIINKIKSLKTISSKVTSLINEDSLKNSSSIKFNTFEKSIDFLNVSFKYDDNKKNILKNINLSFEKGKKYAIIGSSGSGKSSILKLILKYYNTFEGNIKIDNIDINNIDIDDINKNISIIQQNIFMFDDTIKNNITLYNSYSDDEIKNAVKNAGLNYFINSLPNGLSEKIGENGCKISGGERQRIAIARALIKKSSILLLDESTSALDTETSYNIEKSILNLKGITTIVITHKLIYEILKNYDELIILKNGFIVEKGSFESLIKEKGYFYNLYNISKT